jgi:hypothetical protein
VVEEVELYGSEFKVLVRDPYETPRGIQFEIPCANDLLLVFFIGATGGLAPKQSAEARQKLLDLEGLRQVVIGSRLEAFHFLLHRVAPGQKQHQDIVEHHVLSHPPADVEAVHPGHADVQDDEIGAVAARYTECREAVWRGKDLIALSLQLAAQQIHDHLLVIHNENRGHA